ncbi:MAG: DUF1003 domain-containing protein [Nanoarchaeota archaeon]|nr:DUF1003 domain-containing protein [Nanoarchaeota archaeon]
MVKKKNGLKDLPHKKLTLGQRAADKLTQVAGSWGFIFSVLIFIAVWVALNITAFIGRWDPWPFILLNLFLSCLAALQAPVILMSQNRSNEKDRRRVEYDYIIDRKTHHELQEIKKELKLMKRLLRK